MVSVLKRTRKLQSLISIRNGPGAAILPPEVTRIHMDFSLQTKHGHIGAKRFWRSHLMRLKYYNPAIPMTVARTSDATAPAVMTLSYPEKTEVIDMKHLPESTILTQLMALTKARAVRSSPEDTKLMQELEEQEAQNSRVRELMKAVTDKRKREEDILKQARGEAEALKNED